MANPSTSRMFPRVSEFQTDKVFAGSIPKIYDEYLVPLIFESYAADLASRVDVHDSGRLLEIAAGTGVVTRALTSTLPTGISIIATDLNPAMIEHAALAGTTRPVEWRQADAMRLPFEDATFDCVVCQFGAMFFPDKPRAYSEIRRVLRSGGEFLFSVWDRIEENEFAEVVTRTLALTYPDSPPEFLRRTPHGYYDKQQIERDIWAAGFSAAPAIDTVAARSQAASARIAAIAYCQGTPLRNEIEERRGRLDEVTALATAALEKCFGKGGVDGKIQAHIISVRNSK